ncbi:MAG: hypothetical protein Q8O72_01795 [Bacteroidales bacterium]|nr:hypothetical protein [Bacteroidales bacterium]
MELSVKIRKKLLFVILGTLLLLVFSYQLSFKKTIVLYQEYQVILDERYQKIDLPEQLKLLQDQLDDIAGTIGTSGDVLVNKRRLIIDRVSNYCNDNSIRIIELAPSLVTKESSFVIETNIIKTEGSFANLLKLVNILEREKAIGKVISVRFATSLNRKTKAKELISEIFVQNITNQDK